MAIIVAVDDDEMVLSVLAQVLESQGHKVQRALDGPKALELIRQNCPDLVISDIRMSPMSGMELLRTIRRERPGLPVIMLTAFTSPETIRESRELGASDHLSKPFTTQDVVKAVQRVLCAHEPQQSSPEMRGLINEYMVREHLKDPFDAKTALADELFWASQKYDEAKVLSALNEALGRTDITQDYVRRLLLFRDSLVRIKQMAESAAARSGAEPAAQMQKAAEYLAGAKAKGDYAARVRLAAEALGVEPDRIANEDVAVLGEYAEYMAARESPEGVAKGPNDVVLTDDLDKRMAGFTSVELEQLYGAIHFGPVLTDVQIESLSRAIRGLRGRTDPVCKALRALPKAHRNLASVGSLVPKGATQLLADLHMSESELQQMMNSLNAMADRSHVLLRIKEIIEASAEKKTMAAFWVKYWKKRYSDDL